MLRPLGIAAFLLGMFTAGAGAATISGTVTDLSGKPIQNARVDHIGKQVVVAPVDSKVPPSKDEVRTDANGHFRVNTEVPAIVIRSPGFQSQRVLVTGNTDVKITLQSIKVPGCTIDRLPPVKTVSSNDIDYTEDTFIVETTRGRFGIRRGRGPMYSFGAPSDDEVWKSADYFEVMTTGGEIDARGHTADGKYWRTRTFFGAATHYYGVDKETADLLDCIMDRVI